MAKNGSGWVSRFWFALEYNDQRLVKQMLTNGANVNHIFKEPGHRRYGQSPIFIAVSRNNKDMVGLLLAFNCELEHTDNWGETPLFVAVRRGKLPLAKSLVKHGSNLNHTNKNCENVLFVALKLGRKDLVDYFIGQGVDADCVNKNGSTPLLLALELYENACSLRHATRRTAPSNTADIICSLIPVTSSLNHVHSIRGTALRLALSIETTHFSHDLRVSKLLMQHGNIPDRLFFLKFGGLHASTSLPGAEFFTEEFFNLSLAAGANLQREKVWLITVLGEMPQELQPFEHLFQALLEKAMSPCSLQNLCRIAVRRQLGGHLWQKIGCLPLPTTLKNFLKLRIL